MDFLKSKPDPDPTISFLLILPTWRLIGSAPKFLILLGRKIFLTRNGRIILESPGEKVLQFTGWELAKVLGKEKRGSPVHRIYRPAQPLPAQ